MKPYQIMNKVLQAPYGQTESLIRSADREIKLKDCTLSFFA
jgi:hypothetical protein